ncbi:MAG: hypothetical protein R6W73_05220 [Candidatus Saliniplasma sp.]
MDLIGILLNAGSDPLTYSIIFFVYVVLAAVVLPIPVEIGLFNPYINPILLISILAVGKGVGSFFVFEIGTKARKKMKKISTSNSFINKIVEYSEWFVKKWGYYGLLIILSTPLMIDSISLYLFSLLNPEKKGEGMDMRPFILVNIVGGAIRGIITLAVFYYAGIKLA